MTMLVAGNWKMFKGAHEARRFAMTIRHLPERTAGVDVVVCPTYTALEATIKGCRSRCAATATSQAAMMHTAVSLSRP